MNGYSDVINHAFAFAAKHHDQQVRKGTKLPYLTHPANVAVSLRDTDGTSRRSSTFGWYRDVYKRLVEIGFSGEIMNELERVTADLESRA